MNILIVNVGSTSLKYKVYTFPEEIILAQGKLERIGSPDAIVSHTTTGKNAYRNVEPIQDYTTAIQLAIRLLTDNQFGAIADVTEISAIGFKTVIAQGITGCVILDETVLAAMEEFAAVAPSHNPPYINAIRSFKNICPETPLLGLFEPSFHRDIPTYAYQLGIPLHLAEKYGIRKYGFHGASHRYIAERVTQLLGSKYRLISCHLGGSSSLCAIRDGISIDTSMSFSPQSGIIHANRIGDLDPFAVLYLMDKENLTTNQIRTILCKESGLSGISGIKGGDMRDIESAAKQGNTRAITAIDTFAYSVQKYIGQYLVALEGIDILVFTGGIGEHSALLREKICHKLSFLGIKLDISKNRSVVGEKPIHTEDSIVQLWVIPTNEELIVARAVKDTITRQDSV
ncbi:MAG: acetate/propionate family kinase [bacterium]|nr:acetate/propionate family kinase [bacterium]